MAHLTWSGQREPAELAHRFRCCFLVVVVIPDGLRLPLDRIVRGGAALAGVGAVLQTGVHALSEVSSDAPYPYLSVNAERNPIAWAHGVAIFASAFVCTLTALVTRWNVLHLGALAATLAFLSLDEMTMIHERIVNQATDLLGVSAVWDSVLWPAIYAPLGSALTVLLWRLARDAPRPVYRPVMVGLVLLVIAVAAEVLSAPWTDSPNRIHAIEGAVEEAAEVAGWITIATGLSAMAVIKITQLSPSRGPEVESHRRTGF